MRKYRSREAPVPGSSVSEAHPGFWADCIKKERLIEENWYRTYGNLYYDKQDGTTKAASGTEYPMHGHGIAEQGAPHDRQVSCSEPVAYLRSRLKEEARPVTHPRRHEYRAYNIPPHEYQNVCQPTDCRYGYQPPSGYSSSPHGFGKTPQCAGVKYGQQPYSGSLYLCHEIPQSQVADHILGHPSSLVYMCQKVPQTALVLRGAPVGFSRCDSFFAQQKFNEPWHNSLQNRKGGCAYSTPGNIRQQHVRDSGTSFGHHSYQFKQQNPGNCAKVEMCNSFGVTQDHRNPSDDLQTPTFLQNDGKNSDDLQRPTFLQNDRKGSQKVKGLGQRKY